MSGISQRSSRWLAQLPELIGHVRILPRGLRGCVHFGSMSICSTELFPEQTAMAVAAW